MVISMLDFSPTSSPSDLEYMPESVKERMRFRALTDTYYLATNVMGYTKLTPNTHGPLCAFLDTCKVNRRLIQMPRSHFKTVCVTIVHRTQEVLKDPSRRILIVGDTGTNASKHLQKIKNQLEKNRLLRWLFPDRVWADVQQAPKWSEEALFLPQDINGSVALHGEPTFDSIGAGGGVVSRHYDTINPDDIIAEDEYYSPLEMSKVIDWFSNLEGLFTPPLEAGQMDIPSTYWRTDDVYAFSEEFFGGGKEPVETGPYSYQRGGIAVFRRGAIENGEPIFPPVYNEKGEIVNGYPKEFFDRLREKNPERYAAQYANNPKSSENAYFRQEYLRYYEIRDTDGHFLTYVGSDNFQHTVDIRQLVIHSFCDPNAGGNNRFRGSRAAVITTAVDVRWPRIFILDAWIKRAPTNILVDEIFRQNAKWTPETFSIEGNGLQKMLKYWIDERTEREPDRYSEVPYVPYIPKGGKDDEARIQGLQPLFKAGQIYGQRGFSELWEEYASYPRGLKDGLDCLAQGLGYWNVGMGTTEQEYEAYEREMLSMRSVATGY